MYIGLDIGTSSVKAVLIDDAQRIVASRTAPLEVSRPHTGWSEQDAESWWTACEQTMDGLARLAVAFGPISGQLLRRGKTRPTFRV